MRALTRAETRFVAGGQSAEGEPTTLDDVIVTAARKDSSREVSLLDWIKDGLGFDGQFWFQGPGPGGHVVISGGGGAVAIPLDEDGRPHVGATVGADIDPRDGRVGVGVAPSVSWDGSVSSGPYAQAGSVGYWAEVPYTGGGIGMYPVPGGDVGEYYWGPPPGSGLAPF